MENSPDVLFDALVLPDGEEAVSTLRTAGRTAEFISNQYRHCKTILALGASAKLLEPVGVQPTLGGGANDPGIIIAAAEEDAAAQLIDAMTKHRHYERETDPPKV